MEPRVVQLIFPHSLLRGTILAIFQLPAEELLGARVLLAPCGMAAECRLESGEGRPEVRGLIDPGSAEYGLSPPPAKVVLGGRVAIPV